MENKDKINQVIKTTPDDGAGEVCEKITVQGVYPQRIVIKRRLSDSPHKINSHNSCTDTTVKGRNQNSSKLDGENYDEEIQTSKDTSEDEVNVELKNIC